MSRVKYDPDKAITQTMSGLKNFQRATVERIDELFRSGQNHVLVADEVGLGKTLVAKGVIVKTAKLRREENDRLFKVVYICSNLSIARQNIQKLRINENTTVDNVSETRLSMQHLKVTEQENDQKTQDGYIQLIPLTPVTSFHVANGTGDVNERALMFLLLYDAAPFSKNPKAFDELMMGKAISAWDAKKEYFRKRIELCGTKTKGKYPKNVKIQINAAVKQDEALFAAVKRYLADPVKNQNTGGQIVSRLRKVFASISIAMLSPDLVILDEFQRFNELLSDEQPEDMQMLAQAFFKSSSDMRVLLLSATPYKLYSTSEDISDTNCDEAYDGFFKVVRFLEPLDEEYRKFCGIWNKYYFKLHDFCSDDLPAVLHTKETAEKMLYSMVCRTERASVNNTVKGYDIVEGTETLDVSVSDINSNIALGALLREIGEGTLNCIEFAKSAPYLLSFMQKYKLKAQLDNYFKQHPDRMKTADKKYLWLKRSQIDSYQPVPSVNARLSRLFEKAFAQKSAMLLWIPPSRPYYELQGVFKGNEGFSKFLIFSSWEMVPRMIAVLTSFEAECRTIGKLLNKARVKEKKDAHYFADEKKRFPLPRLRFAAAEEGRGMNLLSLLYPSQFLADLWDVKESLNHSNTLKQIEGKLTKQIREKLTQLMKYQNDSNRVDDRWYYAAPMLADKPGHAAEFVTSVSNDLNKDIDTNGSDMKSAVKHIKALLDIVESCRRGKSSLGRMPEDLEDVLVNAALGSPAVCIYRRGRTNAGEAAKLAGVFLDRFNSAEATAVIDLAYGRKKDDAAHWQNVLRYCKDGCFQAMFDEYFHMILDEQAAGEESMQKRSAVLTSMNEKLKFRSASYSVDTFSAFSSRIKGVKEKNEKSIRLRTHFAVCFNNEKSENENTVTRKDSIRAAFNSPLRPFILATTSIGQEGLDFHYYCRNLVHWNLPSNPIELEQREGRIDRYKCLAVRRSIAEKFGAVKFISDDIWKEMFEAASKGIAESGRSELVPFWSLGKEQKTVISRIPMLYPLSRDILNYERLLKMLSLYRLSLGQPNQQELIERILNKVENEEQLRELFIDLSPFERSVDKKQYK